MSSLTTGDLDTLSTSLTTAVIAGDLKALAVALIAGADASVVLPEYQYSKNTYRDLNLVQVAALEDQVEMVGPLVAAGARLDHQTSNYPYHTALHLAARHDHPEMLHQLVPLGLHVDTTDNDG
ncbi:unnamed protein product, partial [Meganyctiphanes norvegica]